MPSNFDDKTFMFNVTTPIYFQDFEGTCPDGWTLTGAWQCRTPAPITGNGNAPPMAFSGNHCLATNLRMGYANNDALASNHATTPAIVLPAGGTPGPRLPRVGRDRVGGFDGCSKLEVSTDGGANWSQVSAVTPAYTMTFGTGGNLWSIDPNQGWEPFHADLSAYAENSIKASVRVL